MTPGFNSRGEDLLCLLALLADCITSSALRKTKQACKSIPLRKLVSKYFYPPMAKPFRLTYLAKGGGCHTPIKILNITCLTFCLLLSHRPILTLAEYKLKVVNICEMHGTGGIKVLVLCAF